MGFDYTTLLMLPLGLLLPVATVICFMLSKNKKTVAYDSVVYGVGAFLGSMVAVFIAFVILNTALSAGFSVDDYTSGFTLVSIIFSALIAVLFVCCESLKMITLKKFMTAETRNRLSSLGFSAGVIIAQNAVFFVALNIFKDTNPTWSMFTGAFIMLTGVVYYVLSYAAERSLSLGSKGAAYALSGIYYLMWICIINAIRSQLLIILSVAFFFVFSLVISYIFIRRKNG